MIPVLSQVCSLQSDFATDIADYAAGQCRDIEVWLTKLEAYLQNHSLDDVRALLAEHSVTLPVASFQGGLLTSQADSRAASWEHFTKRLDLCKQLKISTIVVAADIMMPVDQADIDRSILTLSQAAELAQQNGIRLAIEFQSRSAFINNLQTAAIVVEDINSPNLGICLDAFHFFTGPSKLQDLQRVSVDRLFHVQLSDVADVPREFATDSHRILPGEGDFECGPLDRRATSAGLCRDRLDRADGSSDLASPSGSIWRNWDDVVAHGTWANGVRSWPMKRL